MTSSTGDSRRMRIPGPHRADIAAVVVALGFPTLMTWVYFVGLADSPAGLQQTAMTVGKVLQFAFPLVWVLAIQRRRLAWSRPNVRGLAWGAGSGLLVLAAALFVYHGWLKPEGVLREAGEAIVKKVVGFGIHNWPQYAALGVFYSLVHSLLEEYYWRWFVFGQLRRLTSVGTAIAVSSLGFMAHHVVVLSHYFGLLSVPTLMFSLAVAAGGAFWAWLYHKSDSLYGPWLSHLLVDAAIFIVGYEMVRGALGG